MGEIYAAAQCFICQQKFTFNALKCPSVKHPKTGDKHPICRSCMDLVNRKREQRGMKPFKILEGAYEPYVHHDTGKESHDDDLPDL